MLFPVIAAGFMESSSYRIDYETVSGGGQPESSSSYDLLQSIGEIGADFFQSLTYKGGGGISFGIMANVPPAPTLVNDGSPSYYNKLHFTIDSGNNPSDTLFAIAITDDDWATQEYIQQCSNGACLIGEDLGSEDWQTYSEFGGASGKLVTGLWSETTYKIKVRARQGDFTATDWGPSSAGADTVALSISFAISKDSLDLATVGPSQVESDNHTITTTTNAESGYVTTVIEDGNLRKGADDINDVADGEVSAGHEEYGIRTSGADGQMNSNDTAILDTVQDVAKNIEPISDSIVTVTYKAGISPSTLAGQYQHAVTYICTATF